MRPMRSKRGSSWLRCLLGARRKSSPPPTYRSAREPWPSRSMAFSAEAGGRWAASTRGSSPSQNLAFDSLRHFDPGIEQDRYGLLRLASGSIADLLLHGWKENQSWTSGGRIVAREVTWQPIPGSVWNTTPLHGRHVVLEEVYASLAGRMSVDAKDRYVSAAQQRTEEDAAIWYELCCAVDSTRLCRVALPSLWPRSVLDTTFQLAARMALGWDTRFMECPSCQAWNMLPGK